VARLRAVWTPVHQVRRERRHPRLGRPAVNHRLRSPFARGDGYSGHSSMLFSMLRSIEPNGFVPQGSKVTEIATGSATEIKNRIRRLGLYQTRLVHPPRLHLRRRARPKRTSSRWRHRPDFDPRVRRIMTHAANKMARFLPSEPARQIRSRPMGGLATGQSGPQARRTGHFRRRVKLLLRLRDNRVRTGWIFIYDRQVGCAYLRTNPPSIEITAQGT
jgi:hypothetical protein